MDGIEGTIPMQHTENSHSGAMHVRGSDTAVLDRGVSEEELEVLGSTSSDDAVHLQDRGSPVKEGSVGGGRLTSNDWAFLKTRTILGGKVLDF